MLLKQSPEDFKVIEIIKPPKEDKEGKYTYFWLTKTNYTTVRAIQQIARTLRISTKRLHFSGTKDKYAVTTQLVSVMHLDPSKLDINLKDIEIEPLHRGKERINLGSHNGNRFEIVVRDVKKIPSVHGEFPNYFDEQRFSSNNAEVGRAIVEGFIREAVELILSKDKKSAKLAKKQKWTELINYYDQPLSSERTIVNHLISYTNDYAGAFRFLHKKLRTLYVHAYQSLLFNKALSSTIKGKFKIKVGEESLRVGPVKSEELALPGYKTELSKSDYDKKLAKLLKKDGIKLEDFKIARMPELASYGGSRASSVKVGKLKIGKLIDNTITLGFDLPNGAYATMFVKILFSS